MAGDHMHGMAVEHLLRWVLRDLERGSALGIVKELFFVPRLDDPFRMERYGVTLDTPLGAAAGPHTQMAQNLVAAWLVGCRYMELKTVQVLDGITVTKPCIDMNDEGYNCEWSQELSLDHSYGEYLKAWVLVHVLHDHLGYGESLGRGPGVIFNMSAGYSLEGIMSPTMQRFLDRMTDCAADVEALKRRLEPVYPRIMDLEIPGRISDNLTMSCMHGCPPAEVESIALYFLEQRRFNTTLKVNPTLLGANCLRGMLNKTLGYDIDVPDVAFAHDLPYEEALRIINVCRDAARRQEVAFGVKLTNTLETGNIKQNLPKNEAMVYMSGRPLHPISIALADCLQRDFGGELDMSFCAGVDAVNVADTLAGGLTPVTVCSDLLKPGGYGRMAQYVDTLRTAMGEVQAVDIASFIRSRAGLDNVRMAALRNLGAYSAAITAECSRYAKAAGGRPDVKTDRPLPALDCAAAPCMSVCPAGQNIPGYLEHAAAGDWNGALATILETNPFPGLLGKMCNQACRTKCMRVHHGGALRIRDVKFCAASALCGPESDPDCFAPTALGIRAGRVVAVIGADAVGLACAYFLTRAGCGVTVYEASSQPGGALLKKMTNASDLIDRDIRAILASGVRLRLNECLDVVRLADMVTTHDAVFLTQESGTTEAFSADMPRVFTQPSHAGLLSLVEMVGEGRRSAGIMLAELGVEAPTNSAGRGGLDLAAQEVRRAFRAEAVKLAPGDREAARNEAARCLQCDRFCGTCVSVCPNRANVLLPSEPHAWPVQEVVRDGGGVRVITLAKACVRQPWQVINLGDFCNECGNCAAFCPSAGAPYRDKPRLHLSEASFLADTNGFYRRAADCIEGKRQGRPWTLRMRDGVFIYEDAGLHVKLDGRTFTALDAELLNDCDGASLASAVEAALLATLTADISALCSFGNAHN